MLNLKTVRANTVEEAIEKGLKELNIDRSEAEIRVISEGKKGFLGFGKQEAIVEITQNNNLSLKELTKQLERQSTEEKAAIDQETIKETPKETVTIEAKTVKKAEEVPAAIVKEKEKPVIKKEPAKIKKAEPVIKKAEPEITPEITEVHYVEEDIDEDIEEFEDNDFAEETDKECFQGKNAYESAAIVADYLVDIIRKYGADARVEMDIEGRNVFYDIHTDKSGLVIGKHGKIINSLQILAQTYLSAIHQRHLNVILNVGDYRKRRAKVLQNIAEQKANEAMVKGEPVIIDALPAYERKQIHKHLSYLKNIKTYSQGREPKRVLVVEYQESKGNDR